MEQKKLEMKACGEIETFHLGCLGSQDTFYVGTLKRVGRIYQQTFVDTYSKVATCKLYSMKTPITAADLLNDKVLPLFDKHEVPMLRILIIGLKTTTKREFTRERCATDEPHGKPFWTEKKLLKKIIDRKKSEEVFDNQVIQ